MLKIGGIWVSPIAVEACIIMECPQVLESAAVGAPDGENLIKPKAFVVLQNGSQPAEELAAEIKAYVKKTLVHYKNPRWVEFVDELPKTATGEIKRFMLQKSVDQAAA